MYEDLIRDLFPHRTPDGQPSFRANQFEVIRDTLAAFDDPGVTDVVAELPTGAGKTSIAVTVARVMTRGFRRDLVPAARATVKTGDIESGLGMLADNQAHLITSMKMLQDAYLGDDRTIKLVKGKGNYECRRGGEGGLATLGAIVSGRSVDFSCSEAEDMYGRICETRCPYRRARDEARFAPIALHNFDSFLHQVTLGGAFTPRRLLTVDEAHNAEEKIRGFMTIVVEERSFRALGMDWTPLASEDLDAVTDWVKTLVSGLSTRARQLADDVAMLRGEGGGRIKLADVERLKKSVGLSKLADLLLTRLNRFMGSRNVPEGVRPATWVATNEHGGSQVTLEPVDAGRFVPQALMRYGEKRLHLSATFLDDTGAYTRSVKIRSVGTRRISVPSTFPVIRRPIVVENAGKLGSRDWDKNFPRAVASVRDILDRHPDVRGVLHCTSYDMAAAFKAELNDKRLVSYTPKSRDSVIGAFMAQAGRRDSVLLAVALTEGYDFKHDLCRFQVITRVPFIVPDKCVKARSEKDPRFYGWRTALALVQTYGRGMRAADDYCVTYVLDGRFRDFVKRERELLPKWFLEAIK